MRCFAQSKQKFVPVRKRPEICSVRKRAETKSLVKIMVAYRLVFVTIVPDTQKHHQQQQQKQVNNVDES